MGGPAAERIRAGWGGRGRSQHHDQRGSHGRPQRESPLPDAPHPSPAWCEHQRQHQQHRAGTRGLQPVPRQPCGELHGRQHGSQLLLHLRRESPYRAGCGGSHWHCPGSSCECGHALCGGGGSCLPGLAPHNGVPHNAWEIRTDELGLDRFVCLWYYVRPVFGLASAAVYANLFAHLNTEYANRPGAIQHWENIPPGILGAGGMLQNMADAIAGIYATALVVRGSFFTPEPEAIPAGGSTADLLPWRDNRIPERTLGNAALNPFVRIVMNYDNGMVMANTAPAILQL